MGNQVEIWKSHPEYTGIEVSTLGRVRSLDKMVWNGSGTWSMKGRVLKQSNDKDGYLQVRVLIDGKWTTKKVHRLTAQTFIPNPDNLPEVNHKNCVRDDNRVINLEFCTHLYNIKYREKYGISLEHPVFAINLTTLEVSRFRSRHEASRVLGVNRGNIYSVIKGKRKQTGGFWFVNADDEAVDVVKSKLRDIGKNGLKI